MTISAAMHGFVHSPTERRPAVEKMPPELWVNAIENHIESYFEQASAYTALRASSSRLRRALDGIAPTCALQAFAHRVVNEGSGWRHWFWWKTPAVVPRAFYDELAKLQRLDLSGIRPRATYRIEQGEYNFVGTWKTSFVTSAPCLSDSQRYHALRILQSATQVRHLDLTDTPVQDIFTSTRSFREDTQGATEGPPIVFSEVHALFRGFNQLTTLTLSGTSLASNLLQAIPYESLPLRHVELMDNPWAGQCVPRIGRCSTLCELVLGSSEPPIFAMELAGTPDWENVTWRPFAALSVLRVRNQWFRTSWNPLFRPWSFPNVRVLDLSHDETPTSFCRHLEDFIFDDRQPMQLLHRLCFAAMTNLETLILTRLPVGDDYILDLELDRLPRLRCIEARGTQLTNLAVSTFAKRDTRVVI